MQFLKQTKKQKEHANEQELEKMPLKVMEIIQIYDSGPKSASNCLIKNISFFNYIVAFILFLLILNSTHFLLTNSNNNFKNDIDWPGNKNLITVKNKIIQNNIINVNDNKSKENKNNAKNNIINNVNIKSSENIKKISIGFLSPQLDKFMIIIGEYFAKLEKYNAYFLTNSSNLKKKGTKIEIFKNSTFNYQIVKNVCKLNNIEFIILKENILLSEIQLLKSLGLKIIGIFDDIKILKNKQDLINLSLYDVLIQSEIVYYNIYKNSNLTNNVFIPKIYKSSNNIFSNINNHNIALIGRIKDAKKNGIISALKALSLVIKEFPDAKLNIISSDSETSNLLNVIDTLNLRKNIFFSPFTKKISSYFKNTSLFLYVSLVEEFPYAINAAISHRLPCIISNNISGKIPLKYSCIKQDIFNEKKYAEEIIKLFKDNNYREKIISEGKLSLDKFNVKIIKIWEELFNSLKKGEKEFQKFKREEKAILLMEWKEYFS